MPPSRMVNDNNQLASRIWPADKAVITRALQGASRHHRLHGSAPPCEKAESVIEAPA